MRIFAQSRLSAGVDNLFDRRYAEHIQQGPQTSAPAAT